MISKAEAKRIAYIFYNKRKKSNDSVEHAMAMPAWGKLYKDDKKELIQHIYESVNQVLGDTNNE